ncbi:MAG: hypothetical protein K6G84_13530 [Lachnospiraceae bacterium]|nr:hypothetical protein [Lachnospiraceae bacterium]
MDIVQLFNENDEPLRIDELALLLDEKEISVQKELDRMVSEGIVRKISIRKNTYYCLENQGFTASQFDNARTNLLSWMANIKASRDELSEETESLKNELNKIYSNFISIMGIFVAVFAIVFSNASFTFETIRDYVGTEEIISFIVAEVVTVLMIIILLVALNIFFRRK